MKKSGFTLAEVLITLGIIGVVAALTMPTLVQQSQNRANVSKLLSTVQTVETALGMAIEKERADDIFGTSMYRNNIPNEQQELPTQEQLDVFIGHLKQYLSISNYARQSMHAYYGDHNVDKIYYMNNTTGERGNEWEASDSTNNAFPIELRNGAVMFWRVYGYDNSEESNRESVVTPEGGSLWIKAGEVMIDVNGANAPNILGRDIFSFYLGQDGILYPSGGLDFCLYESNGTSKTDIWTDAGNNNIYACTDGAFGIANNAGSGCTARVLQTGKMDY
ncbi:type II secretion system protein [bacterium]|nr:type II secretion system protein [bacterium]